MKVVYEYSHLGGAEILRVRYPVYGQEIYDVIKAVRARRIKISKEKTKKGKALYSPVDMNEQFRNEFSARGFREIRDTYTITLPNSEVSIPGAFKQVDFVKASVLVEVQFGKYAFMFYDLAKFQYFFNENKADVGVEIVPCHYLQREMSSGVSYGEQLVYDIERLKRHFPDVPVKVILIDVDDEASPIVVADEEAAKSFTEPLKKPRNAAGNRSRHRSFLRFLVISYWFTGFPTGLPESYVSIG